MIEQNVHRVSPDDFVATAGERHQLRQVLKPHKGLYARLSEMHDCGLLTRIFPEFEKVHCRVVRDFYHRYTVDEHTLLAIRNVESLLEPRIAEPEALRLDSSGDTRIRSCSRSRCCSTTSASGARPIMRRRACASRRACSIGWS